MAWILPNAMLTSNAIVDKAQAGANSGIFRFVIGESSPAVASIRFLKSFSGTSVDSVSSVNAFVYYKWAFVAMSWDGSVSAGLVKFYSAKPNAPLSILSHTSANETNATGSANSDGGEPFIIGNLGDGTRGFSGIISNVMFHSVLLSFGEIQKSMFYPGSIRRGIQGHWPIFGYGNIEPDYSGNKNNGIVTGTTFSPKNPPINGIFLPRGFSRHAYVVPAVATTNVTFDATSSSGYQASLSTYTWNHTVANQSNRFLEVSVGIFALGNVTSVTFNNKNLTFVRADVNGVYRSEIWRMVAPDVGTLAVVVNLNVSLTSIGNAQSYYNVDQDEPINIEQGNTGTNTPATGSITPEADSCMLLANLVASTASGITSAGGQTSRTANNGALGTDASDEQGVVTPISSKTFTWNNLGALDSWAVSVIAIQPVRPNFIVPSVPPPKKFRRLMVDIGK